MLSTKGKKKENKNLTKKKESNQDLDQENKQVLRSYFFLFTNFHIWNTIKELINTLYLFYELKLYRQTLKKATPTPKAIWSGQVGGPFSTDSESWNLAGDSSQRDLNALGLIFQVKNKEIFLKRSAGKRLFLYYDRLFIIAYSCYRILLSWNSCTYKPEN